MTEPRQQTLAATAEIEGIGLHTGQVVRLVFRPAEPGSGVRFRRTDLAGSADILVHPDSVVSTERSTTLGVGEARVGTTEHLLAAVVALGIDNLEIEIDGPEVAAMDGSAEPFQDVLQGAGTVTQQIPAAVAALEEPFTLEREGSRYTVLPDPGLRVSASIDFPHPRVGRQWGSYELPADFESQLAAARTFGFLREAEELMSRGLALGASPANAIVLTEEGLHPESVLRFPDEFVRHKALDIVGDLALVGARVRAQVIAERPSHAGNVAVARELRDRMLRRCSLPETPSGAPSETPSVRTARAGAVVAGSAARQLPILTVQQIMQYLPHRYPFLLVDRVLEYEPRKRIVGLKNVTINEPFFAGHFPGHPVMPGVLIVEAMAQVGGLLLMDDIVNPEDKVVYFMSLDNVKWRRPVVPGDQLHFEVEVMQMRRDTVRLRGVARVDGGVVSEAEMMARVVSR